MSKWEINVLLFRIKRITNENLIETWLRIQNKCPYGGTCVKSHSEVEDNTVNPEDLDQETLDNLKLSWIELIPWLSL